MAIKKVTHRMCCYLHFSANWRWHVFSTFP